jgi:hypothetical protein
VRRQDCRDLITACRAKGLRVLMGPFSIYDKSNVEAAAK